MEVRDLKPELADDGREERFVPPAPGDGVAIQWPDDLEERVVRAERRRTVILAPEVHVKPGRWPREDAHLLRKLVRLQVRVLRVAADRLVFERGDEREEHEDARHVGRRRGVVRRR